MANVANYNPRIFDTDFTSFAALGTFLTGDLPLRVRKFELVVGSSAATAGTVLVQDAASGANILAPMVVAASAAANSIVFAEQDNVTPATWANFKVTGLTATGTKLYVWSE